MTHHTSKRLKIVQKGYDGYSGPIGAYEFEDGISLEMIPLNQRDMLSAAFQMVEIDEDGGEQDASVAARMLRDRENAIEATDSLDRQTDDEKLEENVRAVIGGEKIPALYTEKALEGLASAKGIAGVRIVAEVWDVRSKAIPTLIQMILRAQSSYLALRTEELTQRGVDPDELAKMFTPKDVVEIEVEKPEYERSVKAAASKADADIVIDGPIVTGVIVPGAVTEAAATGDMAAALNVTEPAGE